MSAEHLILAGVFAVLFILPLTWLFVFDRGRDGVSRRDGRIDGNVRTEPLSGPLD